MIHREWNRSIWNDVQRSL